jgi:hypothetical protein
MEHLGDLGGFFGLGDLFVAEVGGFIHGRRNMRETPEFYQCAGRQAFTGLGPCHEPVM